MRPFLLVCSFVLLITSVLAQQKISKLSPIINHPAVNVSAPFVSLDGNTLLYVSDDSEDQIPVVFYSQRPDGVNWKTPTAVPKHVHSRLNFLRGFAPTPDGKQVYVTTMKSGGVGGYDLFVSNFTGTSFSEPANVGMPVNTAGHEASPSFTSDGLTMYFMRCNKMDANKAEGCKIFVARRRNATDRWGAPEELPPVVNTGNSQAPRIMGDSETLIFSSNLLAPNKGGMDLYLTRWNGTEWTKPQALEFANTSADDQYVSGTSLGRYLMKEMPGKSKSEIVELLFPPELKPKGVMKLEGTVVSDNPGAAYLSLVDRTTQAKLQSMRPDAAGNFTAFLKEGTNYLLVADPEQEMYTYAVQSFDLTQGRISAFERTRIELKKPTPGDQMELKGIQFKSFSSEMDPASQVELRKLVRLINGNPTLNFSLEVSLIGYRTDSVKGDPDLTELHVDTLHFEVTKVVADSIAADSTEWEQTATFDSTVVKYTYHNDRTPQMSLELVNQLVSMGISANRLRPLHSTQPATRPEERKTLVKLIVR